MTTTEVTYRKRIRVEVSTSVKGVRTHSSTVEMYDAAIEDVLAESDMLVHKLDQRYPPPTE